jgi:hypothetical protein
MRSATANSTSGDINPASIRGTHPLSALTTAELAEFIDPVELQDGLSEPHEIIARGVGGD